MTDNERSFTAEQAAAATGALRDSLGLPPQRFGPQEFVGMISDEIEQLRAAGKSDGDIADLLRDRTDIELSSDAIGRYYAPPHERGRPSQ